MTLEAWMRVRRGAAMLAIGWAATLGAASAETPLERGRYLVETIAACGNCHTPKGPDGPLAGKALAGNWVVEDIPPFRAVASNITPGPCHRHRRLDRCADRPGDPRGHPARWLADRPADADRPLSRPGG